MRNLVFIFASCICTVYAACATQTIASMNTLLRELNQPKSNGSRFVITGDVAFVCGGESARVDIISDCGLQPFWIVQSNASTVIRSGIRVSIEGHIGKPTPDIQKEASANLVSYADKILPLGKSTPLHCTEISGGRIACGDFTNQSVAVRGVLSGARRDDLNPNWNWFTLRTSTGKVFVATPDREFSLEYLKSMTDADVLVNGVAHSSRRSSSFVGFHILPVGPSGITFIRPPPANPLSCPLVPEIHKRGTPGPDHKMKRRLHRCQIRGEVLGSGKDRIFIMTDGGYFSSVMPVCSLAYIKTGCRISAAGFSEINSCGLDLVEAHVRIDAPASKALSSGITVNPKILFAAHDGESPYDPRCQGAILRISGLVANSRESIDYEGIVRLACGEHTVPVDINVLKDRLTEIPDAGYRLEVTGVCFGSFTSGLSTSDLPVFTGFTIYPRVPEDVIVVSRPSWWTPARLTGVILALTVLIVAILIWNRSLAVLSDRRGKRLYAEAIAHTKAEMKVEERTHLAVELHDALSQTLTGVALQIDSACLANRGGNTRVGQVLEVAKSMLASCRKELHNCLWDLRSRTFEEKDMTEAVTRTLAPYSDGVEISVRFNVPREIFEESQSHAILRMVRELAVNAINHGRATRLWIAGEHHDGTVSFSVRDNGCGFDPTAVPGPRQGHFGLQGIRERLEKLDGNLEIHSEPGGGTKVSVRLRVSADPNAAPSSQSKS